MEKKRKINLVLSIILPILLLVTILMGLLAAFAPKVDTEGAEMAKWFDLALKDKDALGKIPGLTATFAFLVVAIVLAITKLVLSTIKPLAAKKEVQVINKIIGYALIVIIVLAAIMAFCSLELYFQEFRVQAKDKGASSEEIKDAIKELRELVKLGSGSIAMGSVGLAAAGVAVANVIVNNKKVAQAA